MAEAPPLFDTTPDTGGLKQMAFTKDATFLTYVASTVA